MGQQFCKETKGFESTIDDQHTYGRIELQEKALQIFHMGRQSAMPEPTISDPHQETNTNLGNVAMDASEQQSISAFFSGQGSKQPLPPGNINRLMSPAKKQGPK